MFKDFEEALNKAKNAIKNLKEEAEYLSDRIEEVIDACETLEGEV